MDSFLPHYSDPLFSIMLVVFLALVIAVVTYGWSLYMQQRQKSQLMLFLEKFEGLECVLDETEIPYIETMNKPLLLLAKAYEKSGEYDKTISIYLYLIRHAKSRELLEQLGKIYLRAGFLERAESIFLEILAQRPRNTEVLYQLGVVYEMLHQYDKAIETLEPLGELGDEIRTLKAFWQLEKLRQDTTLSLEAKEAALLEVLASSPDLYRHAIAALFELSPHTAWQHLDGGRLGEVLDILWYLPESQLDFAIIHSDKKLAKIYFAKGILKEGSIGDYRTPSITSAIDILVAARAAGYGRAELSFTYLCRQCKQSFPVPFRRCPNCLAINTVHVEEQIVQHEERDYSIF